MPIESPLTFYPKYVANFLYKYWKVGTLYVRFIPLRRRLRKDPRAMEYMDTSLSPVTTKELEELDLFSITPAARKAADSALKKAGVRA